MQCQRCGESIEYCGIGRKPKYCESCAYIVDLEKKRKRQQMKREYHEELGTRNFGSKMNRYEDNRPNFKAELNAVRKELRDIGLKKHGTSKAAKK